MQAIFILFSNCNYQGYMLLDSAPLTCALNTINDIAEEIDLFSCSLSEFAIFIHNMLYIMPIILHLAKPVIIEISFVK